ncbi:GntR family transcriptional regulator [Limimaricola pyoseonensis]|uniref:DNA-binding transcriptional regulator, GntR family n=1 Tax=Limimaricola pyoseonensis TaxID=521013 RepID=A0A1G7HU09_9RHOB|nr:GntR family transcriptional regulator [Limimaricola pyoseonensis]SDF03734.1 DNA-binding transcriptional regulator, GntR family [Limimaricola pyoseonensis]
MLRSQDIARSLEQQIVFGRLHPGQRLIEDELLAQFDATRHQVRSALEALVSEGLATKVRNKGVHVRSYTPTEISELYEIRDILQTAAIRRMPLPCPPETVAHLQKLCDAHCAATAPHDLLTLNDAFHETIFALCGNRMLADEVAAHTRATHPIRSRGFFDAEYLSIARREHQQMVDALRDGDRDALIALNSRHIERPKQRYLEMRAALDLA